MQRIPSLASIAGFILLLLILPGLSPSAAWADPQEDEEPIEFWRDDLKNPDPYRSYYAAVQLFELSDREKAFQILLEGLKDSEEKVRKNIAEALSHPDTQKALSRHPDLARRWVEALEPFLIRENGDMRKLIINGLGSLDVPSVYAFFGRRLAAPESTPNAEAKRKAALDVLTRMNIKPAVRAMIGALAKAPANQREPILRALHTLTGVSFSNHEEWAKWYEEQKEKSPIDWLRDRLAKERELRRRSEERELAIWQKYIDLLKGDPKSQPLLVKELREKAQSGENPRLRTAAITELGELQTSESLSVLLELLQSPSLTVDQMAATIRSVEKHNDLLGEHRPDIIQRLHSLLGGPLSELKPTILHALGTLGAAESVPPIVSLLESDHLSTELVVEAITALARIRENPEGRASEAIRKQVESELARKDEGNKEILETGLKALGELKYSNPSEAAEKVLALLQSLHEHSDVRLRFFAVSSLGKLGLPAIDPLIQALSDPEQGVRGQAVGALTRIGKTTDAPARRKILRAMVSLLDAPTNEGLQPVLKAIDQLTANLVELQAVSLLLENEQEKYLRLANLLTLLPNEAPEAEESRSVYYELLRHRAEARAALANWEGAIADYTKLVAHQPKHAPFHLALAEGQLASGKWQEAEKTAEAVADTIQPEGQQDYWAFRLRIIEEALKGGAGIDEVRPHFQTLTATLPDELKSTFKARLESLTAKLKPAEEKPEEGTGEEKEEEKKEDSKTESQPE